MTTRFKISIAAGAAILVLAVAAPVFVAAQQEQQPRRLGPGFQGPPLGAPGMPGLRGRGPGGPGGPMGFGAGFRGLDLTDDQQAQLKQIADSHREEFQAAGEKARTAHEGMRALMEADTIDEAAIRAKSADVAAAGAEVMILNAKVRKESLQVLSSEQLAKLKELRDQRPGPGPRGFGGPRLRRGQQQQQF